MKRLTFKNYVALKEGIEGPKKTSTDRKLEKGQEFLVDRHNNASLIPVINAFNNADKVRVGDFIPGGYATVKSDGGVEEPKLKKKSLYLVGGAVRDHMLGKKPKDHDLATDATPSEIRMILLSAGFTEVSPEGGAEKSKKVNPEGIKAPKGVKSDPNKIFYSKGWDREGNEFVIGIRIGNGDEMELATFREDSKSGDGRTPDRMKFSDLQGDSNRRDFTINSMYIKLDNSDGANNKLFDPHGGLTHMMGGKGKTDVLFVGKASDRLEEDQLRAFRYVRFYCKYGAGSIAGIPGKYMETLKELAKGNFPAVSKERAREEFLKGLEDDEVDPKKYVRLYKEIGLLSKVFPGLEFKLDGPDDYTDEKDRLVAVSWILRNNDPQKVAAMLNKSGWPNSEVKAIKWLMDYAKSNPDDDGDALMRMHTGNPWPGEFANDGGRLDRWSKMHKKPAQGVDAFRKFLKTPLPSVYDQDQMVMPDFADLVDPISQQAHGPEIGKRKAELVAKMYKNLISGKQE